MRVLSAVRKKNLSETSINVVLPVVQGLMSLSALPQYQQKYPLCKIHGSTPEMSTGLFLVCDDEKLLYNGTRVVAYSTMIKKLGWLG